MRKYMTKQNIQKKNLETFGTCSERFDYSSEKHSYRITPSIYPIIY